MITLNNEHGRFHTVLVSLQIKFKGLYRCNNRVGLLDVWLVGLCCGGNCVHRYTALKHSMHNQHHFKCRSVLYIFLLAYFIDYRFVCLFR